MRAPVAALAVGLVSLLALVAVAHADADAAPYADGPVMKEPRVVSLLKRSIPFYDTKSKTKRDVINAALALKKGLTVDFGGLATKYGRLALTVSEAAYRPTDVMHGDFEKGFTSDYCPGITFSHFHRKEVKATEAVFVSVSIPEKRTVVLAFRGTKTSNDIMVDLNIVPKPVSFGGQACGRMHGGFLNTYRSVIDDVKAQFSMWIQMKAFDTYLFTGHSLGAAVATAAAMDIVSDIPEIAKNVSLVLFGQPNVGDKEYLTCAARLLPRTISIENKGDPVTIIPAELYGTGVEYSLPCAHSPGACHKVSSYFEGLDAQMGPGICKRPGGKKGK